MLITASRVADAEAHRPAAIDTSWTVREVVSRYPASVAVFKAFNVEACCDAGRPIVEAAERAGIDGHILLEALTDSLGLRA